MVGNVAPIPSQGFLRSLNNFEQNCPKDLLPRFLKMREILEHPAPKIQSSRDIYPLYSDALKIGSSLDDVRNKGDFLAILSAANGRIVQRTGAPPISLNFSPITDVIDFDAAEPQISCSPEIVDRKNEKAVQEAAEAVDRLCNEGIGYSFGVHVFKAIIRSSPALCVVARNQKQQIIGCALGTLVHINPSQSDFLPVPVKVFHFWFLVRQANHPSIHLADSLQAFQDHLRSNFDPDFLSLIVGIYNFEAKRIYIDAGFDDVSMIDQNASYMLKSMRREAIPKPPSHMLSTALIAQSLQTIGYGWGILSTAALKITLFSRRLWYR